MGRTGRVTFVKICIETFYFFQYLDCDVFLTDPKVLKRMISVNYTVVAPMLDTVGKFANFWALPSQDSKPILERKKKACHQVNMVYSSVLIHLKRPETLNLTFLAMNEDGIPTLFTPEDDFYSSAQRNS